MAKITKKFKAEGMHCQSCEELIERSVKKLEGVSKVHADYETETGEVTFDSGRVTIKEIFDTIEKKGYECWPVGGTKKVVDKGTAVDKGEAGKDSDYYNFSIPSIDTKLIGMAFGIIGVLVAGYFVFTISDGIAFPQISQNMGYGLLFLVGLLTGFHCISMCGGFVVSYTAKDAQAGVKSHKSHLMYGFGKTVSYTVMGAAFGLLGSIVAFTPMMRGVAGIIAGLFLIVFGLNMLNVFPWLRKVRIKAPKFLSKFVRTESKKHRSPLAIGLLNGLMIACGPLQAIYIMAAGTGSAIEGAKLLFVFALGTLPVMIGFGFFASFLSGKATRKILKASGIIIIVLGVIMMNRGLALTGAGVDAFTVFATIADEDAMATGNVALVEGGYQVIRMDVIRYGWEPDKFVLKKGVPVKWIINGKEINGCNNAIQVPKYGLEFDIQQGEQVIEFTPDKEGTITWSCWMGMIPGVFVVKDDVDLSNAAAIQEELANIPELPKGSCGDSCGSPTCGAATGGGCGCGR